eukprot:TRINITY_DN7336_c2_g2_i1.p1 TRINITY_DN7336_c2_g2~~TRINITY_DN7336_c2_g2_i1.p1  ORF type:complete len:106 (-),score=9.62 TRINITY_DN7336_c2_g2_i1:908-1225(-)
MKGGSIIGSIQVFHKFQFVSSWSYHGIRASDISSGFNNIKSLSILFDTISVDLRSKDSSSWTSISKRTSAIWDRDHCRSTQFLRGLPATIKTTPTTLSVLVDWLF